MQILNEIDNRRWRKAQRENELLELRRREVAALEAMARRRVKRLRRNKKRKP